MVTRYSKLKYSKSDKERYPKNDEARKEGEVRSPFEVGGRDDNLLVVSFER